jgi:hypothetical protein
VFTTQIQPQPSPPQALLLFFEIKEELTLNFWWAFGGLRLESLQRHEEGFEEHLDFWLTEKLSFSVLKLNEL